MKITKIDLCVKDLDASVKFYEEAFGFNTLKVMETGLGKTAVLACDGLTLTLLTSPKLPIGIVSLGTDIDGDINAAVDELQSKGAKLVMEPQRLGLGYMAKVFDPNDISIQVMKVDLDGTDSGDRLTHLPNKIK